MCARARLVATEACRLAENGAAFIERVRDELDLELEIVDRKTEAYLAVTGCASLADPKAQSRHRVRYRRRLDGDRLARRPGAAMPFADPCKRIRAWDSLPVGVVTLAERHGGIDVTPEIFEGMVEEVVRAPARFRARRGSQAGRAEHFHLLGTSGTVTTVGGIHLGLPRYDRRRVDGLWMRDGEISTVMRRPAALDFDRARRKSLHRQGARRSGPRRLRHT